MPRIRPEGGLSGTYQTPTVYNASGMWTMRDLDRNRRIGSWPVDVAGSDPYFSYNALMIHADGVSGANNTNIKYTSNGNIIPFLDTYSVNFPGTLGIKTGNASGNFVLSGDLTMEGWVYFSAAPTNMSIFNNYNTNLSTTFDIEVSAADKLAVYVNSASSVRITSTTTLVSGVWYHYAVVRSAGVFKLYLNGVQEGSTYAFSGAVGSSGEQVYIGQYNNGSRLNGYISNLRVKSTAVYTANFTPPTTTFTADSDTQFLVGNSPTFVDNSQNAYTLQNSGAGNVTVGPTALTNSATAPGQGTFTPFSQPAGNWSTYLDGASILSVPANANFLIGTQNFTIECWVFITNSGSIQGLVTSHQTGGMIQFYVTAARNVFAAVNTDGGATSAYTTLTSAGTINNGVWNHLAVVRNGTEIAIYINGVKDTNTMTLAANTNIGSFGGNKAFYIGSTADQGNKSTGYFSNVRYVLGSAVYSSNFTPSSGPLSAISGTQILTCQDNRFKDNSTNASTLTLVSVPSIQPFSPFAPAVAYSTTTNGGSLAFSGAEYTRLATATTALAIGTGDFTIEFYVYFNSVATGMPFDLRTNPGVGSQVKPSIYISAAGTLSYYTSATARISSTVTAGQWYHIAAVRSSGVTRLYVNGIQNATTYADTADYGASCQFTLGVSADTLAGQYLNGYISNVRVKRSAVYSTAFTPPTQPFTYDSNTALLMTAIDGATIDGTAKNTLISSGNVTISTSTAKYGNGSISFNGSSYIRNSNNNPHFIYNRSDFTIEMWVYLNSTGNQTFYDSRPSGTASTIGYIQFAYITGALIYATAGGTQINGGALNVGQWYHLAVCRSGTSTKLFVNGIQVGVTYTDTQVYLNGAGRPIIGADGNNPAANFLNGYIDELRVTKYARYTSNFTPPVGPPLDR